MSWYLLRAGYLVMSWYLLHAGYLLMSWVRLNFGNAVSYEAEQRILIDRR